MSIEKVLIVDDEILVRDFLGETLCRKGLEVTTEGSAKHAIELLKHQVFDLVITDMRMPDATGIDILKKTKELSPKTLVIIITAFGSIENAVEAMKLGAYNYLIKPFSPDTIEAIIDKAQEHMNLVEENHYLRQQVSHQGSDVGVIGESPVMKKILADVDRIAQSNANVFITGESGTGKEVIAQAIHFRSLRKDRPYIKVNCAAVPDTLIESEFFGHEKGAFTGANIKRLGRFELANTGTLLLDEVTEVPLVLQAKLLRAIQEREFERVGGSKSITVDVRLISTSNRDIQKAIADHHFREDLYYRLNVVPIHLPPLRERKEDIIPLAEHFIKKICIENHKTMMSLSPEAQKRLLEYNWPGNIRELSNIIERAVVMNSSAVIAEEDLHLQAQPASTVLPNDIKTLEEMEKQLIIATLKSKQGVRKQTADALGISEKTLRNKLKSYRLNLP